MSTVRREEARHLKNGEGITICSCGCGEIPKPPRKTWFSKKCVEEWRIKNDPGYVRALVKRRDHGICAMCGTDTVAFRAGIETRLTDPLRHWQWWTQKRATETLPLYPTWSNALNAARRELRSWKQEIEDEWRAHSEWQADHILPVCEGGGQCSLENYRTLCTACHQRATAALAARRAAKARQSRRAVSAPAEFQLSA